MKDDEASTLRNDEISWQKKQRNGGRSLGQQCGTPAQAFPFPAIASVGLGGHRRSVLRDVNAASRLHWPARPGRSLCPLAGISVDRRSWYAMWRALPPPAVGQLFGPSLDDEAAAETLDYLETG